MVFAGILDGCDRKGHGAGKAGDSRPALDFRELGHSMLELLVCMGIVLLLLAAALPKGSNMDKMYVKYDTMRLMNLIRYIQTWSHQWDYCTHEHMESGKGYVRPTLHFYNGHWYYVKTGLKVKYDYDMANGVSITSNKKNYTFNARGHSTAGTIRISKNGYEERIIIDTVGRARVEEG